MWRPHVGFDGLVAVNGLLRLPKQSLQLLQCSRDYEVDVGYLLPHVLLANILHIVSKPYLSNCDGKKLDREGAGGGEASCTSSLRGRKSAYATLLTGMKLLRREGRSRMRPKYPLQSTRERP